MNDDIERHLAHINRHIERMKRKIGDMEGRIDDLQDQLDDLGSCAECRGRDEREHEHEPERREVAKGAIVCTPKTLDRDQQAEAAAMAVRINPVNSPLASPMLGMALGGGVLPPQAISVLTSRYWGPSARTLSVSFLELAPPDLRKRILSHMNAWSQRCCIKFAETNDTGDVRISRQTPGYWSYLGTDIRLIEADKPTMSLEGFTMQTADKEFYRVVRHETGHTLGFPHEHMRKELVARIDRKAAYEYFKDFGWNRDTVDEQVLTALDERQLMGTPPDQTSIMCYQLPAKITKDGKAILGGSDINKTDFDFAAKIYPPRSRGSDVADGGRDGDGSRLAD